ncbi:Hypothetical predicted protein [Marmota monax]|uniref:Uncharacterized protein n=1 Tax=Marmota monax TaxID=9995 RepID=A0A5E4A3V2_MARMO|nr:hypothetical protein GHT09_005972 [Marmota monax]VTJ51920.1 Hypothetical predicted protein [Marmota monax]
MAVENRCVSFQAPVTQRLEILAGEIGGVLRNFRHQRSCQDWIVPDNRIPLLVSTLKRHSRYIFPKGTFTGKNS